MFVRVGAASGFGGLVISLYVCLRSWVNLVFHVFGWGAVLRWKRLWI